jgi:H+/Cl- antiporter ClcA
VSSLLLYSAFYYLLAAITYGAFIPSGLFTVSLIFGGCFGRIWAEVLLMLNLIDGSEPGIVGMYALLGAGASGCTQARMAVHAGSAEVWLLMSHNNPQKQSCCCCCRCPAAAFLGGLMRMSASMCLILMEMTGTRAVQHTQTSPVAPGTETLRTNGTTE